eukprot:gene16529-18207_t
MGQTIPQDIRLFHGPNLKEKETWDPRNTKFAKTLDLWQSRDLSLR